MVMEFGEIDHLRMVVDRIRFILTKNLCSQILSLKNAIQKLSSNLNATVELVDAGVLIVYMTPKRKYSNKQVKS